MAKKSGHLKEDNDWQLTRFLTNLSNGIALLLWRFTVKLRINRKMHPVFNKATLWLQLFLILRPQNRTVCLTHVVYLLWMFVYVLWFCLLSLKRTFWKTVRFTIMYGNIHDSKGRSGTCIKRARDVRSLISTFVLWFSVCVCVCVCKQNAPLCQALAGGNVSVARLIITCDTKANRERTHTHKKSVCFFVAHYDYRPQGRHCSKCVCVCYIPLNISD